MDNNRFVQAAAWAAVLQCLLGLSWTVYVVFLPGMLLAAGIDRSWLLWILLVDQLCFVVLDWIFGVWSDRVRSLGGRLLAGPIILVATVSAGLMIVLPWAAMGVPALFLAVTFLWSMSSSVLRAPVVSLLAQASSRMPGGWVAGAMATGIGMAGALGLPLAATLRGIDPAMPMTVTSLVLLYAAWQARRIETLLREGVTGTDGASAEVHTSLGRDTARVPWMAFGVLLLVAVLAAWGAQAFAVILVEPRLKALAMTPTAYWLVLFWLGMALAALPGARIARSRAGFRVAGGAMLIGAAALVGSMGTERRELLALGLVVAGVAWGIVLATLFAGVLQLGGQTRRPGGGTGALFSMLALAALLRIGWVLRGGASSSITDELAAGAWLVAAGLLLWIGAANARRRAGKMPAH